MMLVILSDRQKKRIMIMMSQITTVVPDEDKVFMQDQINSLASGNEISENDLIRLEKILQPETERKRLLVRNDEPPMETKNEEESSADPQGELKRQMLHYLRYLEQIRNSKNMRNRQLLKRRGKQ